MHLMLAGIAVILFAVALAAGHHFGGGRLIAAVERRLGSWATGARIKARIAYYRHVVPLLMALGVAQIVLLAVPVAIMRLVGIKTGVSNGLLTFIVGLATCGVALCHAAVARRLHATGASARLGRAAVPVRYALAGVCLLGAFFTAYFGITPVDQAAWWLAMVTIGSALLGGGWTMWNIFRPIRRYSITTQLTAAFVSYAAQGFCLLVAGLLHVTDDPQLNHALALVGSAQILMALALPKLYGEIAVKLVAYGVYSLEGITNMLLRVGIAISDGKRSLKDVMGPDGAIFATEEKWLPEYRAFWGKMECWINPMLALANALLSPAVLGFAAVFGLSRSLWWRYLEHVGKDTTKRRQKAALGFGKLWYAIILLLTMPFMLVPSAAVGINAAQIVLESGIALAFIKISVALSVGIHQFVAILIFTTGLIALHKAWKIKKVETSETDKDKSVYPRQPVLRAVLSIGLSLAIFCSFCGFVYANIHSPLKDRMEKKVDKLIGEVPLAEQLAPKLSQTKELGVRIGLPTLSEPERFTECRMTIERGEPERLEFATVKDGIPMDRPEWVDDPPVKGKRYLYRVKLDCPKKDTVIGRTRDIAVIVDKDNKSSPSVAAPPRKTLLASRAGEGGKPGKDAYCKRHSQSRACN